MPVVYLYANQRTQAHTTSLESINFSLHNRIHLTSIHTTMVLSLDADDLSSELLQNGDQ